MENNNKNNEAELKDNGSELGSKIKARLEKNPKKTYYWMVAIIIVSIVIVTIKTVLQAPVKNPLNSYSEKKLNIKDQVMESSGVGNIVDLGSAYFELKDLEKEIEGLLNKEKLTHQDSLKLLQAFETLNRINKKVK